MKICIVGTGYVGLVSGACLADKGHDVVCVDLDAAKVDRINLADSPIYEPGLSEILKRNIASGRLRATTQLRSALLESEVSLIAVGTPFDGAHIDLSYIETCARNIGEVLPDHSGFHTVVVKSTVVPGTTTGLVKRTLEQASGRMAGRDFGLGMNPEFLREGEAISDFMSPDRIVIGCHDERSHAALAGVYAPFEGTPVIVTSCSSAEMIKYTANALLANLISFSNDIGNLCAQLPGMDVRDVMQGVHLDRRFTTCLDDGRRVTPGVTTYLAAGAGFGGSCFPKDVAALDAFAVDHGQPLTSLQATLAINAAQPTRMVELCRRHYPVLEGLPVAVLGLAFKPGTDDIRQSASLKVVETLEREGAMIRAHDPQGQDNFRALGWERTTFCDSMRETVAGASVVFLMTSWPEFRGLPDLIDPSVLVIDGRGFFEPDLFARYEAIGRGPAGGNPLA